MLTWLAARTGIGRLATAGLVMLGLLAVLALAEWRTAAAIERQTAQASQTARDERDAHWKAEIAAANAAVARARADQVTRAARADAAQRDTESRLETALKYLETRNAELPDGDRCGLGRDRVRLLDDAR